MADVLIRDIPEEVLACVDANAKRMGLSRSEYIRRQLAGSAARSPLSVTSEHLARFSERFSDLADPEVMRRAWK